VTWTSKLKKNWPKGRVTVTTGDLKATFKSRSDNSAAIQIAFLQHLLLDQIEENERLRNESK
jgi:hypothetical protein